jgi:hypothetical protein
VVEAVRRTFTELGHDFGLFTIAPRWGDPPRYELLIEPGVYMRRHADLAARIDQYLCRQNMEYAERLQSGRLRPLAIRVVPEGTWDVFRAQRLRRGGTMEQYKHPCLSNDVNFTQKLFDLLNHVGREAAESDESMSFAEAR